jgi:hypothetical protein
MKPPHPQLRRLKMKKGDIVRFKKVGDPGDDKLRMILLEDPNGDRVLVETLLGWEINPTYVYLINDLVKCE